MAAYNPFEALLEPEMPADARERARLLGGALRRDADFGTLMQLMNTQGTSQAGQTLQRGAYSGLNMAVDKQRTESQERARAEERRQAQANADRAFNEERRQFGLQERRLRESAEGEKRKRYQHAVDPISGEIFLYDVTTGEKVGTTMGGSAAPGRVAPGADPTAGLDIPITGAAGASPGKYTESQRVGALRSGEGTIALRNALNAGFPDEGRISSLPDTAMTLANRAGFPQAASEQVQRQSAFWSNVADPIVRARTGAAMPVEEFNNQMAMLIPRPGEAPSVQMDKAIQLVAFLKSGTVGLPPAMQQHLLAQLAQIEQAIPKNELEWSQMRGAAKQQPAPVSTPTPAAPTSSGRNFEAEYGVK